MESDILEFVEASMNLLWQKCQISEDVRLYLWVNSLWSVHRLRECERYVCCKSSTEHATYENLSISLSGLFTAKVDTVFLPHPRLSRIAGLPFSVQDIGHSLLCRAWTIVAGDAVATADMRWGDITSLSDTSSVLKYFRHQVCHGQRTRDRRLGRR